MGHTRSRRLLGQEVEEARLAHVGHADDAHLQVVAHTAKASSLGLLLLLLLGGHGALRGLKPPARAATDISSSRATVTDLKSCRAVATDLSSSRAAATDLRSCRDGQACCERLDHLVQLYVHPACCERQITRLCSARM